jgi:hypothetical protein
MLDPKAFEAAFRNFMAAFGKALGSSSVVAIDGKALKRAYDKGKAHAPKMMVSPFAAEMRMTLNCLGAKGGNDRSGARRSRPQRSQGQDRHRRCPQLSRQDGAKDQ